MAKCITDIYAEQAAYVKNSGFTVTMNEMMGTVSIESANGEDAIYLQGHEGEEYVAEVRKQWEDAFHVDFDTVTYAHAKQYIDSL